MRKEGGKRFFFGYGTNETEKMIVNNKVVSHNHASVTGHNNTVYGRHSVVTGNGNVVYGFGAVVTGIGNVVCGANSVVSGHSNIVRGDHCVITGNTNVARGAYSVVAGHENVVRGNHSTVSGNNKVHANNCNINSKHAGFLAAHRPRTSRNAAHTSSAKRPACARTDARTLYGRARTQTAAGTETDDDDYSFVYHSDDRADNRADNSSHDDNDEHIAVACSRLVIASPDN